MDHKFEKAEMDEKEMREAMSKEWLDLEHLCYTDFLEIHSKYALEDEV